jgi:hypothetical protein
VVIVCRIAEMPFRHVTKLRRALTGFVNVFDVLGSYADLVGS